MQFLLTNLFLAVSIHFPSQFGLFNATGIESPVQPKGMLNYDIKIKFVCIAKL